MGDLTTEEGSRETCDKTTLVGAGWGGSATRYAHWVAIGHTSVPFRPAPLGVAVLRLQSAQRISG